MKPSLSLWYMLTPSGKNWPSILINVLRLKGLNNLRIKIMIFSMVKAHNHLKKKKKCILREKIVFWKKKLYFERINCILKEKIVFWKKNILHNYIIFIPCIEILCNVPLQLSSLPAKQLAACLRFNILICWPRTV